MFGVIDRDGRSSGHLECSCACRSPAALFFLIVRARLACGAAYKATVPANSTALPLNSISAGSFDSRSAHHDWLLFEQLCWSGVRTGLANFSCARVPESVFCLLFPGFAAVGGLIRFA